MSVPQTELDKLLKQADNVIQRDAKKSAPVTENKGTVAKPTTLAQKASEAIKGIPSFVGGAAAGVVDAVNPMNIPHNLETLARVPFESGGVLERLKKASDAPHAIGEYTLHNLAVASRAVPSAIFTDKSLLGAIKEEEDFQNEYEKGAYGYGKTTGELGAGIYGLYGLAKSAPSLIKSATNTFTKISSKLSQAKNTKELMDAQKSLSEILGDVAPEVGKAIIQRTGEVKKLLNGPEEGRSLFPLVQKMRQHIQDTKDFIGPMVGAYRDLVFSSTKNKINTNEMVNLIDSLQAEKTLGSGVATLSSSDIAKVQEIRGMLGGIENQQISPKDALLITDKIDDWLRPVFGGSNRGGVASAGEYVLSGVRTAMKDRLHAMFPKYAKVDAEYSAFKDAEALVGSRLDGMNAESVVSGLFGKNKTEFREAVDTLMSRAKETQKTIEGLSKDIKIIPEPKIATVTIPENKFNGVVEVTKNKPLTLAQTTRNKANVIAQGLSQEAAKAKIPSAKDFFDEAANIIAARKIKDTTSSGWGDMMADKIRAIVDRYAHEGELLGRAKGQKIGGIAGAVVGSLAGAPAGGLVSAVSGGGAGTIGAKIGGSIGAAKGFAEGIKRGEMATNVPAMLDKLIAIRGAVPPESKTILNDIQFVYKNLGPEVAQRLLYLIPVSPASTALIDAATKGQSK